MKRFCLLLILTFCKILLSTEFALAAPFQSARIQGVILQADSLFRDSENEVVELEGNVQVIFQNQHLKCQRARMNLRAKTVDASGDVLITSPEANIGGERVILEYENSTGVIYQGYVQSGTVLFEGSVINKTSDIDYLANNAKYTACTTCPEAWSFSGAKIRAELGGYAFIKNSVMRLGGFPVFWFPYLVVPLKSDRQTGLLTPSFESQDPGGLILSQPFFWAISRSQDATITMKNYELRGLKSLLEYNYVLDQNSYGQLNTAFLNDRVFAGEDRLNTFRSASQKNSLLNRWYYNYEHYYELPDGYVHRMQLANASDLQYTKDFSMEMKSGSDSALENRMSLTKNTVSDHFSIDASYYTNLIQSNPLAGNDDSVHRLPELRYSRALSRVGESNFFWSLDLNSTSFVRSSSGYDELNTSYNASATANNRYRANSCSNPYFTDNPACVATQDGKYDSGQDLIRTGNRLDFQPTLYRPMQLTQGIDILPKLSFRETDYRFGFGENSSISRRYLRAELAARLTASGLYGDRNNRDANLVKHEVQPELTFTSIPWFDQPDHPFFGSRQGGDIPVSNQQFVSDADINSPFGFQFDYGDRISDRKLITFSILNTLTQKTWANEIAQYLQFFSWKLSQSYDFFQAERNDPSKQALSDVTSELRLASRYITFSQQANYYPSQQVTNSSSSIRFSSEAKDAIVLNYLLQYKIIPGQEVDRGLRIEEYKLILRKYSKHVDFLASSTLDGNPKYQDRRFKLWAYGIELKIPGDCSSVQILDKIENGIREQKVQFGFVWDGQAKSTFIDRASGLSYFGI